MGGLNTVLNKSSYEFYVLRQYSSWTFLVFKKQLRQKVERYISRGGFRVSRAAPSPTQFGIEVGKMFAGKTNRPGKSFIEGHPSSPDGRLLVAFLAGVLR